MEKITEVRKGYYPLVARIVIISVIFDLILLLISLSMASLDYQIENVWIIIIQIVKWLLLFYYAAFITWKWSQVYFRFEGNHLVKYIGLYNPQQVEYNLKNLDSVATKISLLGRILKYGHLDLTFQMQDGTHQKIEIPYVVEPQKLKSYISKYLD